MKWHPHIKFATPGIVALVLVALLQDFIHPRYRPYVFASVIATLLLGLITGQFRRMAEHQSSRQEDLHQPENQTE